MKHIFVVNPTAGEKKWQKLENSIREVADRKGIDYAFCVAEDVHDLPTILHAEAEKTEDTVRFYACGGDGTICQVANAIFDIPNAECALIPAGTGNDFSRNFSNREYFSSIERQIDGKAHKIDTILCNGIHCVNMVNIGFDCDVVAKTDGIKKKTPFKGSFAYLVGVFFTFLRKYGTEMTLEFPDGTVIEKELLLTAIGNGGFCGGGFHSNPRAVLNDGLFDLCMINKVSRLSFLRLISSYKKGTHLTLGKAKDLISYHRISSLKMNFKKPVGICIDGEIFHDDKVELTLMPRSIAFSIPEGSAPILPHTEDEAPLSATAETVMRSKLAADSKSPEGSYPLVP